MLVVGLDPGSIKTGYAIVLVDRGDVQYVECGVISAPANDNAWPRIKIISADLATLLDSHHFGRGDIVGVETAYVPQDRGPKGVETLAHARGALVQVCLQRDLEVVTVAPSTVKKAVTGSGRSDKEAVAEMVRKRFKLRNTPAPDAADALGIALAVANGAGK